MITSRFALYYIHVAHFFYKCFFLFDLFFFLNPIAC